MATGKGWCRSEVSLNMLGGLVLLRDGESVQLPCSKRTRALLAYLARTARSHRRDRLCDLFWENAEDPRGALRWSLCKMRPLLNDHASERLVADRDRLCLSACDIDIDVNSVLKKIDAPKMTLSELKDINEQLKEPFLQGLDIPDLPIYQKWLVGEREALGHARAKVLVRLIRHANTLPQERLKWAREWEEVEPYNPEAGTELVRSLDMVGQSLQSASVRDALRRRFLNAGVAWSPDVWVQNKAKVPFASGGRSELIGGGLSAREKVQFCAAKGGARIAYASVGQGMPIVKAASWLGHLEYDWGGPAFSPLLQELAEGYRIIRYDERGAGLSDRSVADISFESCVADLEAVVDAAGVDRFVLMGASQGAAISIEYAVRHPERVSHLILFGGYAAGWRFHADESARREREAILTLVESGWGGNNPIYRHIFSSTFMPGANDGELAWFNEFQRLAVSSQNAVRFLSLCADIDVRHRLSKVGVPTLVMHSVGDQWVPVSVGRELGESIPGAEFMELESDGHFLLGREAASRAFIDAVKGFVSCKSGYPCRRGALSLR